MASTNFLFPSSSYGQEVSPSEPQLQLMAKASEAYQREDYDIAVLLLQRAVDQGKHNFVYLNLGRALQKAGRCLEARVAFDRVPNEPPVQTPSQAQIEQLAKEFSAELNEQCEPRILVTCDNLDVGIRLDGGDLLCGVEHRVRPGDHELQVRERGQTASSTLHFRYGDSKRLSVGGDAFWASSDEELSFPHEEDDESSDGPPEGPRFFEENAGTLLILGGASLVVAGLSGLTALNAPSKTDGESWVTVQYVFYPLSAVFFISGIHGLVKRNDSAKGQASRPMMVGLRGVF